MNQYVRIPDPLCTTEDMVQNWKKWKNDFVVFMKASNNINAPIETKVFLLKNYIGEFGQNIIDRIMSKNLECRNNMDMLLSELDNHFDSPKTEITERYNFFTAQKDRKKSFNDYVVYLKEKSENCNFGTMRDSLIRDKIIAELKDEQLIKKLISRQNLDLLTLVSICHSHALEVEKRKQVSLGNKVNKCKPNVEGNKHTHPRSKHSRNCRNCDQKHPIRACPAFGNKCKCGLYNHYDSCCPNNTISERKESTARVTVSLIVAQVVNIFTCLYGLILGRKNDNLQQENLQGPSAPPLSAMGNATDNQTLYPSLNHIKMVEDETSARSWSWLTEHNAKIDENLQKSSEQEQTKAASNNVIDIIKRYMKH